MSFLELTKSRYSTRRFSSRPVEQEKLDVLYEVIRNAPTAKNLQPQRVFVLRSPEALEKAKKATPCVYGAPLVFLVCVDTDQVWKAPSRPDVDTADIDGTIVVTQLALEAEELGLGSVIVRMFDIEETKKIFELPANLKPILFLPVGYKDEKDAPSPKHLDKKPLEELIVEL